MFVRSDRVWGVSLSASIARSRDLKYLGLIWVVGTRIQIDLISLLCMKIMQAPQEEHP